MAVALASVGGFVDAVGYITLLAVFTGAVFGSWSHGRWSLHALLIPLVVLAVVIAVDLVRPIHDTAPDG